MSIEPISGKELGLLRNYLSATMASLDRCGTQVNVGTLRSLLARLDAVEARNKSMVDEICSFSTFLAEQPEDCLGRNHDTGHPYRDEAIGWLDSAAVGITQ